MTWVDVGALAVVVLGLVALVGMLVRYGGSPAAPPLPDVMRWNWESWGVDPSASPAEAGAHEHKEADDAE